MTSRATILLSLLALWPHDTAISAPSHEEVSLSEAAETFCTALRKEPISGIPSLQQWERLVALVTPELRSVFESALRYREEQARRFPDEKPDWIEGDLFGSYYEGVTTWEIGEVSLKPGSDAAVEVKNTHIGADQEVITWSDRLVFKSRDNRWLVDDIRMGSDWDFATGESLRSGLPGGIRESENHDSLDGRWHIAFTRIADEVTRITIAPIDASSPPVILFGENEETCPLPTFVVWSPDCDRIAISLGDGIRYRHSLLYRLVDSRWQSIAGLETFPRKKQAWIADGFHERNRTIEARHWQDANTIVLHYFGIYVKQDGSDESETFDELLSVRIDADGELSVTESVTTPSE